MWAQETFVHCQPKIETHSQRQIRGITITVRQSTIKYQRHKNYPNTFSHVSRHATQITKLDLRPYEQSISPQCALIYLAESNNE
jgi:hypothetical protein